jgi:hypothetical protein
MKSYSFKWLVKIPAGHFMTGIHRFKTKKEATAFVDQWNKTPGNAHGLTFSQLPTVTKAWVSYERDG